MTSRPEIPGSGKAIDVHWMQQALAAGGPPIPRTLRDVAVEDIGAGVGLLGEILRCRLTWEGGTGAAPASVIVKLPTSERKNLRMCRRLSLYKREYDYYRHISGQAPIRSPALLYGDFEARSQRFVLVLEDLHGMTTTDQIAGASAEQARRTVRALARLHGFYWNRIDRPPVSGRYDCFSPKRLKLVQLVYLASLAPTLDRFGDFFTDEMRQLAEAYGPRVADHIGGLAAAPRTVIHGDARLDNIFFDAGGDDDVAMIDWQVSGLGNGLYDVAYFLGGSVSTEIRREIELAALNEYRDIVSDMSANDLAFEECWRFYRQNMLACLLISVFACGGLDLNDDRSRQLAETGLQRTLTAIEDLDAAECLPAQRPLFSPANSFSALSRAAYRVYRALH